MHLPYLHEQIKQVLWQAQNARIRLIQLTLILHLLLFTPLKIEQFYMAVMAHGADMICAVQTALMKASDSSVF